MKILEAVGKHAKNYGAGKCHTKPLVTFSTSKHQHS